MRDSSSSNGAPNDVRAMGRGDAAAAKPRRRVIWIWVILCALLPAGWSLGASWIAEDTAIVGYVDRAPYWQDAIGPQYGVSLVSFWRPVVTYTWGLQNALHGAEPAAFRALNLMAHAGAALCLWQLLRRLGVEELGAALGGMALGCFPEQGGTVTWISGRTDLLVGVGMLATLLAAHGSRPAAQPGGEWKLAATWWACPLAFLACATKEFAFLLPAGVVLLSWARDDTRRLAMRRFVPVLVGCVLAFVARRLALGTWGGGYPAALPSLPAGVLGTARAIGSSWNPASLLVLPVLGLGFLRRTLLPRLAWAGLGLWLLGVLPLYPLLADGHLEPQNVRLYFVADIGLCVMLAAAFARPAAQLAGVFVALAFALALIASRGSSAFESAREWATAAEVAAAAEEAARSSVANASSEPQETQPVWFTHFPRSHAGAYCMGFGVVDRFHEPFEVPARPIWPWRSVSGFAASERSARAVSRGDGSLWPEDAPRVPLVPVEVFTASGERLAEGAALALDASVLQPDPELAPQLLLRGEYPGLGVEVCALTPAGYEAVILGPLAPGDEHRLSLKTLFESSNGIYSIGSLLQQAADLGARRAFLELRVLDSTGAMQAVGPLLELVWDEAFVARALGR